MALVALAAAAAAVARDMAGQVGRRSAKAAFVPAGARRQAIMSVLCGGAVAEAGAQAACAYQLESNRQAEYMSKATTLNQAADFLLFELRPLVYPPQELVSKAVCEEMGDNCPERAGLSVISEMLRRPPAGSAVVVQLSRLDRDIYSPMKILATDAVLDPDTSDDLRDIVQSMEITGAKIESYARKGDLTATRKYYDQAVKEVNDYFKKVNDATGIPNESEYFLTLMPNDQKTIDENPFWQNRFKRWAVKRKVDAVSKGNKTARFYAKTMFGDDAVSWDPRGDRAPDFWK